jgi:hypothetical protein
VNICFVRLQAQIKGSEVAEPASRVRDLFGTGLGAASRLETTSITALYGQLRRGTWAAALPY